MSSPVRDQWLSLTPEPEYDLPAAIATLRTGGVPDQKAIDAERMRAERVVLRGNEREWQAWIRETAELAEAQHSDEPGVPSARELVLDVINNHDALQLGLPGKGRRRGDGKQADAEKFERIRARNEKGPT